MAVRRVDVFGSPGEKRSLEEDEEVSFDEYKYLCFCGTTFRRVGSVNWEVFVWLTSFPAELQEVKNFRNDCTFCNYSMDIASDSSSGFIKAEVRKTKGDNVFTLEGKNLQHLLTLLSEREKIETNDVLVTDEREEEKQSDNEICTREETEHEQKNATTRQLSTESKQTVHRLSSCENVSESRLRDEDVEERVKPYTYTMTSRPRGVCMIISNEDFHSLSDASRLEKRHGAKQDVEKLCAMFSRLHFEVELFTNLRDNEVVMTAKHMSLKDHSACDAFVCCILSHGTQGSVFGVNHVAVPISEVLSQFRSRACHTLAGKPKLFFIQACQGLEPQMGVAVTDAPSMPHPAKLAADGTDFLVAYSTEPGYVAFRHKESGSYFIDALVKNLEGLSDYSIHDVMAKVCSDVSQLNINNGFKQVPQFTSTLTKQLFLCGKSVIVVDDDESRSSLEENTTSSPSLQHDVTPDKQHSETKKSLMCVVS